MILEQLPGTGQHQVTLMNRLARADAPTDDRHVPGVAVEVRARCEEAGAGRVTIVEKRVGAPPHSLRGAYQRGAKVIVYVRER